MNKNILYLAIVIGTLLSGCSSVTPGNHGEAQEEYNKIEKKYEELFEDEIKSREITSLEKRYRELLEVLNKSGDKSSKDLENLKNKVLKRLNILEDLKD